MKNLKSSKPFCVITHINLRGGIGKTTASVSLARRASELGLRTCLLDLDSQASASLAFGIRAEADEPVFYDLWQTPAESVAGAIRKIDKKLSVLPSSLQNSLLDSSLASPVSQKNAVRGVVSALEVLGHDLVVIDCPPSLGAGVISAICASDEIVIPTGFDSFSFRGIEITLNEIHSILSAFGLPTPSIRILYSRYDRREKASIDALVRLEKEYGAMLLPTFIRTSVDFNKALAAGQTVFDMTAESKAWQDYDAYARAILGLPAKKTAKRSAADDLTKTVRRNPVAKCQIDSAIDLAIEPIIPEVAFPSNEIGK